MTLIPIAFLFVVTSVGPFSGVSVERIVDTPYLQAKPLVSATGQQLLRYGRGMKPDPKDPRLVQIVDKDFSLEFTPKLEQGLYHVSVDAVAPDGSTDSFWVELDGQRCRRPFALPRKAMRTARFGLEIKRPGQHRVRLVLREAPGCVLRRVAIEKLLFRPPHRAMRPEVERRRPRIFLSPERLRALKAALSTPVLRKHYAAPGLFYRNAPGYSPKRRTCSSFLQLSHYSLAERLKPDPERFDRIVHWLRVAATYPHWGHGSVVDVDLDAEYMMEGIALAYDWLHDRLPPDVRAAVRDQIAKHCAILYRSSLAGRTGGVHKFQQNHFWFAHLALGLGAAAVYGEAPEAETWLAWAFDRFERVFLTLGDDGGFHEQPTYWDFSMPTLFKMIDLYEQCSGLHIPYGDEGLRKAAVFRLHLVYPGMKLTAAFGDTRITKGPPPPYLMYWLAKRFRDPVAQGIGELFLKKPRSDWMSLLWYEPSIKPRNPFEVVSTAHWYRDVQMAFARTSWDADATMFAFISRPLGGEKWAAICRRFGLGGTGHNHPAQNHFVLFGRGQVLAADPGYTYKKKTENHNTILVDGKGQLGDGEAWPRPNAGRAHIVGFTAKDGVYLVTGEAASAYPPELGLTRFERTLAMVSRSLVVVYDRIAAKQPHTYTWLLHYYGEAKQTANGWTLRVGDARLVVRTLLPGVCQAKSFTQSPVYGPPYNTPNKPHINALAFTTKPTKATTFLVPLQIGVEGERMQKVELVRRDGYDALQLPGVCVVFNAGDRVVNVELPSGRKVKTSARALVWLRRGDRTVLVEHLP